VVLLLAEVENMSCHEIAQALEIPVGTVWTRLHHARKELSQLLQEEDV
jgi:RNA polymerase sigma-70 factor (ECF subfamily)